MDNLNNEDIHNHPCRTRGSLRDPAVRRSGVCNICIKNLDPSITVKEINDTFANFGEISSCKVPTDENGVSEGVAYVDFNVEADAEKAISAINGKMIGGKIVHVAKFVPGNQKLANQKDFTRCYVRNLGAHFQDGDLRELFEQFGEVVSAKVIVDEEGDSKGIGVVSYKEHEDALRAVNTLNGRVVGDKPIYVGPAMDKAERQRELGARFEKTHQERLQQQKSRVDISIRNLHDDIDDERLRKEFSVFGNITRAKVMLNEENNTSKGFGFVSFSAPDDAARAVSEMDGKIVEGKPLFVALVKQKEVRVSPWRSQFHQRVRQTEIAFNQGIKTHTMNPYSPGFFMSRRRNTLGGRRFRNTSYIQTRNIGMSDNQNIMADMGLNYQRRNSINQDRNAHLDDIKADMRLNYQRRNSISQDRNAHLDDEKKKPDIESQIDLTTTSKIANADSMEAKQLLGEQIYPLVSKIAGDMAGKITGMFLELDKFEVLYMIENENSLRMKIDEALLVLNTCKDKNGENQNIRQNRNARLIAGNVQLNQQKPQCSTVETGRQGDDGPTYYAG